jgi:hypothetical protein
MSTPQDPLQQASTTPPAPVPTAPPAPPDSLAEALRFYQIATQQVTECRASFEMYYRITLGAAAVVIVTFLTLFYFRYGREYSSLQAKADRDFDQVSQKMQKRIEQRANDAFSTPAMAEAIHKAAAAQVRTAVTSEVAGELSTLRGGVESNRTAIADLKGKDGTFVWSISLLAPDTDSAPNNPEIYTLGRFVPNGDITVTRVVAPNVGRSGANCSTPPSFYLSAGEDRGPSNARYKLALPNAGMNRLMGGRSADSGPVSVPFSAGVPITASFQLASDPRGTCHNITNPEGVSDNIAVQYTTRK